jgi:S1-C subfamily serine protease
MRTLWLTLVVVVLWAASALAQERPLLSIPQVIAKVKKGVICVEPIEVKQEVAMAYGSGGSGFVFEVDYDKGEAYAITNHHVAGQALVCRVTFWNDTSYRAERVASEPGIDVALIKIFGIPDERDLPDSQKTIIPCVLADSDQVTLGEWGIAMGSPGANQGENVDRSNPYEDFLLRQNATANVVTGRATPLEFMTGIWEQNRGSGSYDPQGLGWQYGTNFDYVFRMSTPINGGNSGGPLFNARGEVIGINFYGGGFALAQNSNWAIPINLAKDFAFQILQTGKFERPWLGLDIIMPPYIMRADDYVEFRERYRPDKMVIYGVRKDSPASRAVRKGGLGNQAGLAKDDVILEIDGQKFKSPEDVRKYVLSLDIGAKVTLVVERKGMRLDPIEIEVGPKRGYDAEFSV